MCEDERQYVPKCCYELDPAAIGKEEMF